MCFFSGFTKHMMLEITLQLHVNPRSFLLLAAAFALMGFIPLGCEETPDNMDRRWEISFLNGNSTGNIRAL